MEAELEVNIAVLVGFLLETAHELQDLRFQLFIEVKAGFLRRRVEESY